MVTDMHCGKSCNIISQLILHSTAPQFITLLHPLQFVVPINHTWLLVLILNAPVHSPHGQQPWFIAHID